MNSSYRPQLRARLVRMEEVEVDGGGRRERTSWCMCLRGLKEGNKEQDVPKVSSPKRNKNQYVNEQERERARQSHVQVDRFADCGEKRASGWEAHGGYVRMGLTHSKAINGQRGARQAGDRLCGLSRPSLDWAPNPRLAPNPGRSNPHQPTMSTMRGFAWVLD